MVLGPNGPQWIFCSVFNGDRPELLQLVKTGHSLSSWFNSHDEGKVYKKHRLTYRCKRGEAE